MREFLRSPRGRAAGVYFTASAAVALLVAYAISRTPPPGPMVFINILVALLLAWWVARGVGWVTRLLAMLCAGRTLLHLMNFVYPEELYWNLRALPALQVQLADGQQHAGYFATGMLLATATIFLAKAGWGGQGNVE